MGKKQTQQQATKSNHDGRPKGYKVPDDVWKAFLKYRDHIKDNPRLRQEKKMKAAQKKMLNELKELEEQDAVDDKKNI